MTKINEEEKLYDPERNFVINMLDNSVLPEEKDKIGFLLAEVETANAKISML